MRHAAALFSSVMTSLAGAVFTPAAIWAPPLLAVACATQARAQQVEFEKYSLPNGMTVILHEDHSLPVATVNIWYRVGAQDEPPGRSGFAHLFEHLMFMGTQRVPGNQFDVLMESAGGANNASTDLHRTNYYSWGPSKLLPTLLWLDADRLEDMGLQMNQEKLDKQRDVVRNELRQVVENAPYQKAAEAVFKLLYTPDHPYYYGVIGTHEDLEAANVTNVKDFFANFYVPSNASLVVAGDFDRAAIKPLIADLFGTLPPGQPVVRKYARPSDPIPVRLPGVKRFTAIDKVQQPKVEFTYHAPVAFGPGDAEMQLAARVLADGKASRLYKRLVMGEKLAVEVTAAQQGYPLGGIFQVAVYTRPDADLDRVEKIIDEEIARLLERGPTTDELDRQRAAIELETLAQLQSIERKADKLNEYEYYWGDPDGFKRDLDRFRSAMPDQVREWATRTLTPGQRVIVRVLPEEPQREPSARDTRPADSSEGTFSLPPVESFTAGDGLKVHVWTRKDLPLVAMRLIAQPGGTLDDPGSPGLASLAAAMMSEGAGDLDALAFENAVQSIGADFSTTADHHTLDASMTVLKRSFDRGLSLFADAVRRPRFDPADFARVKTLTVEELRQRGEVPAAVAAVVGDRLIAGDANPYAWPESGTVQSVEKIELGGVKSAYDRIVNPGASTLLIAGDITAAEARPAIEKAFGGWKAVTQTTRAQPGNYAMPARKDLLVAIVDRPGSTQTYIRFVAPGVKYTDPTRVDRRLLSTILGGSFTSRLNQNLREDHGYTYGARSRYDMNINAGTFSAAASVQAEVTGAALSEFLKEFDRLQSGDVTDAEAAKGRETLRNETVRGFQGLSGLLAAASLQLVNGLPFDTVAKDLADMTGTSAAELNSLAATALPVRAGVLVLVGDQQLIRDQIKDLKLPDPVEYDTDGNPVRNSAQAGK